MQSLLVVGVGHRFPVTGNEVLVGRGEAEGEDPSAKINVGGVAGLQGVQTVSRKHAWLREHNGRWYLVVHPQSTNPTTVDGELVPRNTEVPLKDGSSITLGDVALTFQTPTAEPTPDETTIESRNGAVEVAAPILSIAPIPRTEEPGKPTTESWSARLPERPPALEQSGLANLKRVRAFHGLMIDHETWDDAHTYHQNAARLHLLSAHGWGIVQGLEVVKDPNPEPSDVLVVHPGLAIDQQGRTLLLTAGVRLRADGRDDQRRYVVARYVEKHTRPQNGWSGESEATRTVESCEIALERNPPHPPAVELARVQVQQPEQLRDAVDPTRPTSNEIDLRFRPRLAVRPRPDLDVAQLVLPDDREAEPEHGHRLGLRFLMREIGLTTPYRPRWRGVFRLGDDLPPVALLYFSGVKQFASDDGVLAKLRRFLEGGGVLFADPCLGQPTGPAFAASVRALAQRLPVALQPPPRWAPVMTSRHVLPEIGGLEQGEGFVVSTADHGCTWMGGPKDRAVPREAIRHALEVGTNVAVFAQQRQHPLDVLEVEG